MESTHPFSVSFAPCFQAVLCRSQLFFRMFLDKLFQICADRFIMKQKRRCFSPFLLSPSSRRAWIEIMSISVLHYSSYVALLAEGVDRNSLICLLKNWKKVALLAEGVDRNLQTPADRTRHIVALLAEGVDRNWMPAGRLNQVAGSPSSRRAWIEILAYAVFEILSPRRPPRGGRG